MNRYIAAVLALASVLLLPVMARADFRYDNTWMIGRSAAERNAVSKTVSGDLTNYHRARIYNAFCTPKRDASFSHGQYHHFRCVADIRGYYAWVAFDYWQIGSEDYNWRGSDLTFYRCDSKTC